MHIIRQPATTVITARLSNIEFISFQECSSVFSRWFNVSLSTSWINCNMPSNFVTRKWWHGSLSAVVHTHSQLISPDTICSDLWDINLDLGGNKVAETTHDKKVKTCLLDSRVGYNNVTDYRSQQLVFTKLSSYINNKTNTYWYYGHSNAMIDFGKREK